MAQALIFVADGHEEVEMLTVVDMVRRAGISIDMVSITDSYEVTSSHKVTLKTDKLISEVNFDEADMIILPGGIPGTPNLAACKTLTDKIIEFNEKGKMLAAVCAAPTIFAGLGLLGGRKATCYPDMAEKLTGADYVKQPVVVDNNIITSRGMGTCIEFAGAIITKLKDEAIAELVKKKIIYNDEY